MKAEPQAHTSWQAWREAFVKHALPEALAAQLESKDDALSPQIGIVLFQMRTLFDEANAMLLACLQEPAVDARHALADIAADARGVRFSRAPRGLKGSLKETYRQVARMLQRDYPSEADLLQTMFLHYLHDDYDAHADPNLLLREAAFEAAHNRRARALELAALAGAAVLRGRPLWRGWSGEGEGEFPRWALSLWTIFDEWHKVGILPLGSVAEERPRARERAESLFEHDTGSLAELGLAAGFLEDAADGAERDENWMEGWLEMANRDQPLTDAEIRDLGKLYDQYADVAVRTLEVGNLPSDTALHNSLVQLATAAIGVLRYADGHAVQILIGVVRGTDVTLDDDLLQNALWSLEQLGTPALAPVFDFVRYSGDDDTRYLLMEVLGVIGRGSSEVFDYLSGKFLEIGWENDKIEYALALALLHDSRAVPMLCDALSDPAVYDDDAWELLDSLEELGVPFTVDRDSNSVNIPEFGVIENVVPEAWISRAESDAMESEDEEEQAAVSGAWNRNDDDRVVFDAFGIAHCADCGVVLHREDGEWEHPFIEEFSTPQKPVRAEAIGRNDPCPCGSGKKYKHCHGKPSAARLN